MDGDKQLLLCVVAFEAVKGDSSSYKNVEGKWLMR